MSVEMDGMRRRWEMVKPGMAIRLTFDAGERAARAAIGMCVAMGLAMSVPLCEYGCRPNGGVEKDRTE